MKCVPHHPNVNVRVAILGEGVFYWPAWGSVLPCAQTEYKNKAINRNMQLSLSLVSVSFFELHREFVRLPN